MKCCRYFWHFFGFVLPRSVIGWKILCRFLNQSQTKISVCFQLWLIHCLHHMQTSWRVSFTALHWKPLHKCQRFVPVVSLRTADAFLCLLFFGGREATTGNASAVRRLTSHLPWSILGSLGSKLVMCRARENWGEKRAEDSFPATASACYVRELKQRRRNETVT